MEKTMSLTEIIQESIKNKADLEQKKIIEANQQEVKRLSELSPDELKKYEDNFSLEILVKCREMMQNLTPEKYQEANIKELTTSVATLLEKYRLMTERSTQNISTRNISVMVDKISRMSTTISDDTK